MATIQIYNYNNYYNREVKKEADATLYGTPIHIQSNFNFNPRDQVNTTITAGRSGNPYYGGGDYLLVLDDQEIESRWFIIDHNRRCEGQWDLILRRDVMADYYNEWVAATALISKATVNNNDDRLLNDEPISVNQIKQSEALIQDQTKCPWVVAYIDRSITDDSGTQKAKTITGTTSSPVPDKTVSSLSADSDYKYSQSTYSGPFRGETLYVYFALNSAPSNEWREVINIASGNRYSIRTGRTPRTDYRITTSIFNEGIEENIGTIGDQYTRFAKYYSPNYTTVLDSLLLREGEIIKDNSTGKLYKFHVAVEDKLNQEIRIQSNRSGQYLYSAWQALFSTFGSGADVNTFALYGNYQSFRVQYRELTAGQAYQLTIPTQDKREILADAPYDMFCMPYFTGTVEYNTTGAVRTCDITQSLILSLAQDIGRSLGSGKQLYDLQLLPYCPVNAITYSGGQLKYSGSTKGCSTIVSADNTDIVLAPIYWASSSSKSQWVSLETPLKITNRKIDNQCTFYRLTSPNYNGQFEFSLPSVLAAGQTSLSLFKVDFTYLPYNPYIRVAPQFGNLYGSEYTDGRGLICQGDYSIAYLSDAWINYQTTNKNYQNIFNRQIENMETTHRLDVIEQGFSGAAGAIGASTAGMAIGGIGGAIAGGVISAGAALGDQYLNYQRYKEQKSFAEDSFALQLDNIKALPHSLAGVAAQTISNKLCVVLETYSCLDSEKQIVANMIAQQGMTVGAIGKPSAYLNNSWSYNGVKDRGFISGKIIDLNLEDSYNIAQAISEEFTRGVYTK